MFLLIIVCRYLKMKLFSGAGLRIRGRPHYYWRRTENT